MSNLKTLQRFLPNKGLILNKPEEMLKNNFSTLDSRNMEFYNELLQGRLGLDKFDSEQLSGPILLMEQFWKFTGTWYLMIATTKDIYKYDFTNSRFDILTPLYKTGTVNIGTGASAMKVSGAVATVDFTGGGVHAGDYFKLGTGSSISTDSWFAIGSVSGTGTGTAAELTLTTGASITLPTGSALDFTVRKCFQGTSRDFWRARTFQDANFGETWIATNGVDMPVRWSGTGQVIPLTSGPSGFISAKLIEVYKDRVIFLWTVEGGNQPQRERWSGVANCESWDDDDFLDFITDGLWITGTAVMADYHVVFREEDAMVGRYVGGDDIFDYEKAQSCKGVWAMNSLVVYGRDAYFYGPDNKFHKWDLITDEILSEGIYPHTKDYNATLREDIFGWNVAYKNQIRWFAPYSLTSYHNECVVYDYAQNIRQLWEYEQEQALCSIGEYWNMSDLYLDDTTWGEYYLDEAEGYFDDRTFLANAPVTIYGGYDGYVRKADITLLDDGTAYNRIFESIRDNYALPHKKKRLWKEQIWLESNIVGSVTVKLKKDDSNTYEAETKTVSLINTARDIIKSAVTWNKAAQNFKTRLEATNHFALLGYLAYIFDKGKTEN